MSVLYRAFEHAKLSLLGAAACTRSSCFWRRTWRSVIRESVVHFRAETADDLTNGQVAQSRQGSVSGVLCLEGDMSTFGVATQHMGTRIFGGMLLVGGGVQLHMCNSSRRRDAGCGHGRRHAHQ